MDHFWIGILHESTGSTRRRAGKDGAPEKKGNLTCVCVEERELQTRGVDDGAAVTCADCCLASSNKT